MSLWKRIFGREEAAPEPIAAPPPAPPPPEPEESAEERAREHKRLERLRRVGQRDGADVSEAIAILRQHDATPAQSRYLEAIIAGLSDDPALDPLRVACASLLEARGQTLEALRLCSVSRSVPGMMLAAELYASSGKLPQAVSMIERVLARDIDTPGARERHERWSEQLGRKPRQLVVDDGATVVGPALAKTSFRLVREIARGGAGTVYEAEDELLGRRVAYKVYHRPREDRAQIEREARTAVQLAGPGVLRIYDIDPEVGWLACEWIGRGSLRDVLSSGRVAEVLPLSSWLPALLRALGRVHGEGLVHGDIKPANVLFRAPDDPLLSDFGLCQPAGTPAPVGTPGYMSPERIDGSDSDPRDDVYAVGRVIEDVLGERDDAALSAERLAWTEADARRWARVALACMADAASRPADALALLALAEAQPPE